MTKLMSAVSVLVLFGLTPAHAKKIDCLKEDAYFTVSGYQLNGEFKLQALNKGNCSIFFGFPENPDLGRFTGDPSSLKLEVKDKDGNWILIGRLAWPLPEAGSNIRPVGLILEPGVIFEKAKVEITRPYDPEDGYYTRHDAQFEIVNEVPGADPVELRLESRY